MCVGWHTIDWEDTFNCEWNWSSSICNFGKSYFSQYGWSKVFHWKLYCNQRTTKIVSREHWQYNYITGVIENLNNRRTGEETEVQLWTQGSCLLTNIKISIINHGFILCLIFRASSVFFKNSIAISTIVTEALLGTCPVAEIEQMIKIYSSFSRGCPVYKTIKITDGAFLPCGICV